MEGYLPVPNEKSRPRERKRQKKAPMPNETHMKIRAAVDAGDNWELDLERKHGLSDMEACVCVGSLPSTKCTNRSPTRSMG